MEFFIRKNSTLPLLEVDLVKDGRLDYNYVKTNLDDAIIKFSMKNIDTDQYKVLNGLCELDVITNSIYYQFTKKNTLTTGRYMGEFSFQNDQGDIKLPLREVLYVTVLDSFSNSDFCCGPNVNVNPQPLPPTPAAPGIFYGKLISEILTESDISLLTFMNTYNPTNDYVTINSGVGYGYIVIPEDLTQPTGFRDSTGGCFGFNIPTNNIGTINLVDANGFTITYNIYRTYYSFNGQANIWMCN